MISLKLKKAPVKKEEKSFIDNELSTMGSGK